MTARPSGAFCSPPSPRPSDIGSMPMIIASAVISTGRRRVMPAASAACTASTPSLRWSLAKRHDQDAVRGRDADAHDRAHQRRHAERRVRHEQHPGDAGERAGQRHQDDERVEPRLEVDDHQQVDEQHREEQAVAEAAERATPCSRPGP